MAAPSSSYPHHPAQYGGPPYGHPAVGGKGIPMHVPAPVYDPSSPAPSSPSVASSSRYAHQPGLAGGPPDLTERYRLKAKYLKLQKKYFRSLEIRKDLTLELAEKEEKVQQLQDEVDLIIDQIHDSDYAHLRPKHDSLFSDEEDEELELDDDEDLARVKAEDGDEAVEGDIKGKKRIRLRDLEDEEDERRKELEAKYGIDGTKQVVTLAPPEPTPPPPAQIPAAALPTLPPIQPSPAHHAPIASSSSMTAHAQPPQPQPEAQAQQPAAPKRLKLTFGGGGGGASASFA